jgi:hypothetical protein
MQARSLASLDDLAALSVEDLTAWMRRSALSWSTARDQHARLRAFWPIQLSADLPNEAASGTIADELAIAFAGDATLPGEAAVRLLEGWSLPQDGASAAALALQLADAFGAVRIENGFDALITKPSSASAEPDRWLSSTIASVACERLARGSAERLCIHASRVKLLLPQDAARVLAYLASDRLEELPRLAVAMRLPPSGSLAVVNEALAAPLLSVINASEVKAALKKRRTAPEEAARQWILGAVESLEPLRPPRRAWASAATADVEVFRRLEEIEGYLRMTDAGQASIIDNWSKTYAGKSSTLDTTANFDPALDSTQPTNVVNLQSWRANGRR